jgi:hypothetical protein
VLTVYGVVVLSFMMMMYALERRDRRFVLAFALGCALSSSYGFLSGAWPFGVIESVWCVSLSLASPTARGGPGTTNTAASNPHAAHG